MFQRHRTNPSAVRVEVTDRKERSRGKSPTTHITIHKRLLLEEWAWVRGFTDIARKKEPLVENRKRKYACSLYVGKKKRARIWSSLQSAHLESSRYNVQREACVQYAEIDRYHTWND